jgi:hypothetical protein
MPAGGWDSTRAALGGRCRGGEASAFSPSFAMSLQDGSSMDELLYICCP